MAGICWHRLVPFHDSKGLALQAATRHRLEYVEIELEYSEICRNILNYAGIIVMNRLK